MNAQDARLLAKLHQHRRRVEAELALPGEPQSAVARRKTELAEIMGRIAALDPPKKAKSKPAPKAKPKPKSKD